MTGAFSADGVHVILYLGALQERLSDTKAMYAVKPKVVRVRCMEPRRGADSSPARRRATLRKVLISVFTQVYDPAVGHVDQCAVVGLHSQAHIEDHDPVSSYSEPVAADRAQLPRHFGASHLAVNNVTVRPQAFGKFADDLKSIADPAVNDNMCSR